MLSNLFVVLESWATKWTVPNKMEERKDEDEMRSEEMPELSETCRACSFTAQPCAAPEAALNRLGGCWHRCSPPGYVAICSYVCMCEWVWGWEAANSEFRFHNRLKIKKSAYFKVLPIISPHGFRFFFMAIIILRTTITVSWSKPICYGVWIQISSAPVHSWYCGFAERRCICVISPPVEMLR